MLTPDLREALVRVLGEDGVLEPPADLSNYEVAARYGAGVAAAVLRPRTAEEVQTAVDLCISADVAWVTQGANSNLVLAATPDSSGAEVILSLERLTQVLEVDAVDRTVRASAGVRLSQVNAALDPHGLFLPIDLGSDPTVGGMAATNAGGARFLKYGDMRRQVLGLEAVLSQPGAPRVTLGRGIRKDNSMLPLRQLLVGACGRLGVITEVTFEVHPKPCASAAALLVPADGAAPEILRRLELDSGDLLSAFEGMSGAAMSKAFAHVPSLRNPFPNSRLPPYVLLVEFSRQRPGAPVAGDLEAALEALLTANDPLIEDALLGDPANLWSLRHSLSEGLRCAGPLIGFDLAFRRSQVWPFRAAAVQALAGAYPDYEVCDFGHVGDGGIHFNLVRRVREPDTPERLAALRACVLDLAVLEFGGSFSGEHGLGRANEAAWSRYTPAPVKALSTSMQDLFAGRTTLVPSAHQ